MSLSLPCGFFLFLLFTGLVSAQGFRVIPEIPKQGDLLQVSGSAPSRQVRLNGKTILLFDSLALMPVPVKTHPGLYRLEWLDGQGTVIHEQDLRVANAHFPVQNVQLSPALAELHSTSDEHEQVAKFFAQETTVRYWQLPIEAPLQSCLTSLFGVQRAHNGKLTGDIHAGLDQRGAAGTPIRAVAAGEVRLTGSFALHGGTVGIDHGQGLKSMYLHMSKIAVNTGDHVSAGDVIGFVGSTGRSTAPHLHWALYAQGEPVNPLQWLTLRPCAKTTTTQTAKVRRTHPS